MIDDKENKMGTMHEGKLLVSMGIPLMLSMLVAAFYNIVDTFYVSQMKGVGEAAVTALSIAFPIQMLMTALNVGTGVGVGSALSRALGENDRRKASTIAGNAMFLYACYYLIMLLFGIFAARSFVSLFTNDLEVVYLGTTYLSWVTCFSFGNMGEKCFEKILQATGKTSYSMIGQFVGSILNVLLDPIFIFGYFGIPEMGVAGAAIATVIGQCCAIAITGSFHFLKNTEIDNGLMYLKPDKQILVEILKVGAPAMIMQGLTSVTTLGMNLILKGVSLASISAYGIYNKLQNFIFMPAFGINNACVPIIGYNLGAKKIDRIRNTIKYAVMMVFLIMIFGTIIFQLFAEEIVGVFHLSAEFTDLCVISIRIITCGFVFAGINVLLQGLCQAMGKGVQALLIALLRLVVFVLPLAYAVSEFSNAEQYIWIVFPIAELLTFFIAVFLTVRIYRRIEK